MLDPSLKNLLIETLSDNVRIKEMEEIGKMLNKKFHLYQLAEKTSNMSISSRTAATVLVENMDDNNKIADLIKLLSELDNNQILGRTLQMEGFDYFLQQFTKTGYYYDYIKRKVLPIKKEISEQVNWGALKDGKTYPVTILSVDIVGNSELVKKHGSKKMKKVYTQLWNFLRHVLSHSDGRIWSWAGDGGIIAFAFKNQIERAVLFSVEVQRTISLFNMDKQNPCPDPISLRIGINTGKLMFHNDTGQIVSEVVNLAAHLEKQKAPAGAIAITKDVFSGINPRLQGLFQGIGAFEGKNCYVTQTLDSLSIPE